ncbi:hypothetical protein CU103_30255 [Phyllobacterium sophorae]|uniref:Peptidase M20 dimerisation domain-containing protein n=2 Tax=Phyllobacterium sophorae TaxID=1520277 RepID=A0A2P7AN40_9HYPH|nr:hypothetical protein CU103_30255 [Phyllobacterium sophorae]
MPDVDVGTFGICDGSIMAALLEFDITLTGKGGHAAVRHLTIDPVAVAAQIVVALPKPWSPATQTRLIPW